MNKSLSYGSTTKIVLIGTSVSPNDEKILKKIPHVIHNITELERLFTDKQVIGLPDSSIVKILDEEEKDSVIRKVLAAARDATDTLLVYYAGHGLYGDTKEKLYLVSKNSTSEDKKWNAIPISKLREAIAESPAQKRILILDCCYSGLAFEPGMDANESIKDSISIEGTYGVAAAPANHKALAPPGNRLTAFTKELVDVLDNGLPGNNTTLTLSDVFGEVRTRLHLKADMPVPVVSNWKDVGDFRFAMNRYGKKKTTSELITRMDNLIETIESRFSRIDEIIGERDFRSQVGPVVADVGTMASQAGFERYLTFISIVFAVFISLWVQPIFTLYKDAMTIREVSVVFFDWKTVQAVLIFNILICLWWWYGVFLGRMDPAHSFYKYGFDFMTFSSFAITFRNWDHVNVFPIVVIIASALMAIRFGLTLKNWENDRGQTKPDSAKKALRRFLVVLGIYLLIATGAAGVLLLDPSSLATEEGSFDSKVGYGISVLLLIGISATISAVYLTEGMTWSQPRAWYKPPITPPADETDTGASSGE